MFISKRWVKLLIEQALTEPQATLTENQVGLMHLFRKTTRYMLK